MLNIFYHKLTGNVVSYQEGPDAATEADAPLECGVVSTASSEGLFDKGLILYKIDVESRTLVPIKSGPQTL